MNIRKTGPVVLITTLPGEGYTLGILMCAVVTCATNSKVIYLGMDNPIEEIVDASEKYKPKVIAMSISHKFDFTSSEKLLVNLRSKIDQNVLMVTGGKGSPCNVPGVSYFNTFDKYYDYLTNFNQTEKSKMDA